MAFVTQGLGMREVAMELHSEAHDALWGLAGATCKRKVFQDGSSHATILLEIVQYIAPLCVPWPHGLHQGTFGQCPKAEALVRAVLALAASFDLDVIAEGIETEAQKETLLSLGCRKGQGYLLGRPGAAPSFNAADSA